MKLLNVDNDDGRGVVEKEQTVLKLGWGEVSEAITAMDYTKSEDALLYPLSAGALRSLKERKKKKKLLVSLFLPLSVFLRLPLVQHRVLFPPLPVHALWC